MLRQNNYVLRNFVHMQIPRQSKSNKRQMEQQKIKTISYTIKWSMHTHTRKHTQMRGDWSQLAAVVATTAGTHLLLPPWVDLLQKINKIYYDSKTCSKIYIWHSGHEQQTSIKGQRIEFSSDNLTQWPWQWLSVRALNRLRSSYGLFQEWQAKTRNFSHICAVSMLYTTMLKPIFFWKLITYGYDKFH